MCEDIRTCLKKMGVDPKNVPIVPISVKTKQNIFCHERDSRSEDQAEEMSRSAVWDWYYENRGANQEPTYLMDALDKLKVPKRPLIKPLRMPIDYVCRIGGVGAVVCGKIECGQITAAQTILRVSDRNLIELDV